jgi:hypothetical protein
VKDENEMSEIVLYFPGRGIPLRTAMHAANRAHCRLMIRIPRLRRFLTLPQILFWQVD